MSERNARLRDRRKDRDDGARLSIAREAAAVMVGEGVKQYLEAKKIAARRVLGPSYRARDLPSNGEIRDRILARVALAEGAVRPRRLFAMRATALQILRDLEPWHPRLIGSVWSGHARRGSDVDIHAFGDLDAIALDVRERGWAFTHREVPIRTPTGIRVYHHLQVSSWPFPVEVSVYDLSERREVTRSSVDGRPIDRVSAARLEALLWQEHASAFERFCETGLLDFEEEPEGDPFDGLLRELTG